MTDEYVIWQVVFGAVGLILIQVLHRIRASQGNGMRVESLPTKVHAPHRFCPNCGQPNHNPACVACIRRRDPSFKGVPERAAMAEHPQLLRPGEVLRSGGRAVGIVLHEVSSGTSRVVFLPVDNCE